jgi:hypothetical protein
MKNKKDNKIVVYTIKKEWQKYLPKFLWRIFLKKQIKTYENAKYIGNKMIISDNNIEMKECSFTYSDKNIFNEDDVFM